MKRTSSEAINFLFRLLKPTVFEIVTVIFFRAARHCRKLWVPDSYGTCFKIFPVSIVKKKSSFSFFRHFEKSFPPEKMKKFSISFKILKSLLLFRTLKIWFLNLSLRLCIRVLENFKKNIFYPWTVFQRVANSELKKKAD